MRATLALLACALVGCGGDPAVRPVVARRPIKPAPIRVVPPRPVPPPDPISHEILARTTLAPIAEVQHILIGWRDLGPSYSGRIDPRAVDRDRPQALATVMRLLAQLKAGQPFGALLVAASEDPTRVTGQPYTVTPDAELVPEFKALALRLQPGETGVVETRFGFHIMLRVAPEPIESEDVLARPQAGDVAYIRTITLRWHELDLDHREWRFDPRSVQRSYQQTVALAQVLRDALQGGGDVEDIVTENDEHVSTYPDRGPVAVETDETVLPGQDRVHMLALRLTEGEVGIVRTLTGFQIVMRVKPLRDPLDTAAVFARPAEARASIRYILLGWESAAPEIDARAETRTRAQLEKLTKQTLKRAAKGVPFEALMAELSEDGTTALSGEPIAVTRASPLPLELRELALRLLPDEVGVAVTPLGLYIAKRAN